jgi:selenocysteine-specific elongation factor
LAPQVVTARGEQGIIEGSFGKSGKFRVAFPGGVAQPAAGASSSIMLTFKRYVFDVNKRHMVQ